MDTVTFSPSAIAQIKISIEESDSEEMGLRVAARMTADESVEYGLGFDEARNGDIQFECEGITIFISEDNEELLHGTHIDFVELDPGKFNFIFLNPNDPNYKPPTQEDATTKK